MLGGSLKHAANNTLQRTRNSGAALAVAGR